MDRHAKPDANSQEDVARKTVIVTGATGAIGAATCSQFAAKGGNVVLADLPFTSKAASNLIDTFPDSSKALFVPTDISDWTQMKALFKATISRFGSVEFVIANAGVMESKPTLDVESMDEAGDLLEAKEASMVIDVNLKGTLSAIRLGLHHMRNNKSRLQDGSKGSIVLISSTSGYFGSTGVAGYVSSKHGVTGLLRASQSHCDRYDVRLNGIAPFFTPSKMSGGFSKAWTDKGLEQNTPRGLSEVVLKVSTDPAQRGACYLVCGSIVRELERSRTALMSDWVGGDAVELMQNAGRLFAELGGYPLPRLMAMPNGARL